MRGTCLDLLGSLLDQTATLEHVWMVSRRKVRAVTTKQVNKAITGDVLLCRSDLRNSYVWGCP